MNYIYFVIGVSSLSFFIIKIVKKKIYIWLPDYLKSELKNNKIFRHEVLPKHIMFLLVDHFEPSVGGVGPVKELERVNRWIPAYKQLVRGHFDSDGKRPQYCWFYPYDAINFRNLKCLSTLSYEGYGEIELHLHHGNDTHESLRRKLKDALNDYSKVGALITAEEKPQKTYGFIHGMFGLDNSEGEYYCGVNNELGVLKETACYADFSFPAAGTRAQPAKINSIYYATGDDLKSKSYDRGEDAEVGKENKDGLLIVEGPLTINWKDWRHKFYPTIEDGNIASHYLPTQRRVDLWHSSNIHVIGRDDWIFIKVFTHGAEDRNSLDVLQKDMSDMFSYLEKKYKTDKYKLHYVTAREVYNIIKAAEAGKMGDPNDYRDFIIKPYASTKIKSNVLYDLVSYREDSFKMSILEKQYVEIEFKDFILQKISGVLSYIEYIENKEEGKVNLHILGQGEVITIMKSQKRIDSLFNARLNFETEQRDHFLYRAYKNINTEKDKMEASFIK